MTSPDNPTAALGAWMAVGIGVVIVIGLTASRMSRGTS